MRIVFLYDDGNHDCKTNRLGSGIYPAVWTACSRRCQIFHDFVHLFHVDLPSEPVYLSLQSAGIWTNRGVDWNVYWIGPCGVIIFHDPDSTDRNGWITKLFMGGLNLWLYFKIMKADSDKIFPSS